MHSAQKQTLHRQHGALLVQEPSDFQDGEVLTTLYPGANLTVFLEGMNSTEGIIIESYGADIMIDTPPIYACNVSKALTLRDNSS